MHGTFFVVAFFLGAFITNFFKSKKLDALTQEAEDAQSRFYEIQNLSKKQIGEKDEVIRKLQKEKASKVGRLPSPKGSSSESSKRIQSLEDKNKALKQELMSLKAKNKELKIEKAVKQVDKKYPMQLYGMDGDQSSDMGKSEIKTKSEKPLTKKSKLKKLKSKIVSSDDFVSPKRKKSSKANKKTATIKSIKSKKKSKSKKGKTKKVLALVDSSKKRKKGKKSSKKKKKK